MKENSYRKGGFKAFLSEKLEWYDAIYQDIERNGYRRSDSIENKVEVALAANGDLLPSFDFGAAAGFEKDSCRRELGGLKRRKIPARLFGSFNRSSLRRKQKNHCSTVDVSSSPSFGCGEIAGSQEQRWPPRSSQWGWGNVVGS